MSFREKTAWVNWAHVPSLLEPHPRMWVMHAMGMSLLASLVIEVVAWLVLRLRNPQDARIAYYVLSRGRIVYFRRDA